MNRTVGRREFVSLAVSAICAPVASANQQVGGAANAAKKGRVIAACTKHFAENTGDCSGFVKAVASELGLGVSITGQANDICQQMAKEPWVQAGVGNQGATVAGAAAAEGKFVIAGLPAQGNGHVAVLVDYRHSFDSYAPIDKNKAVAFWGKLRSVGSEYTRITRAWTADDLKRVRYAYLEIP